MPNVRNLIYGELKRLYSVSKTFFRGINVNEDIGDSGMKFSIKTDIADGAANVRARMLIYLDESVTTEVLREIGERSVDIVRDTLLPVRRTGGLESSIEYKIVPIYRIVTIYSTHPAAAAMVSGYRHAGSYQAIEDWMNTKSDFDGLPAKKRKETAFLIRRAIAEGKSPGPYSTLGQMRPEGERRFDFLSESESQIVEMVRDVLQDMVQGADSAL